MTFDILVAIVIIVWIVANVAVKMFYIKALEANQHLYLAEKEIERLNRVNRSQQDWMDNHDCEGEYEEEEEDEEELDPERN